MVLFSGVQWIKVLLLFIIIIIILFYILLDSYFSFGLILVIFIENCNENDY